MKTKMKTGVIKESELEKNEDDNLFSVSLQYDSPDGKSGGDVMVLSSSDPNWLIATIEDNLDRLFPPCDGWQRVVSWSPVNRYYPDDEEE